MTNDDINKINKAISDNIVASEQRVIAEVGKFVEDHILPAIDQKADRKDLNKMAAKMENLADKSDIDRIERKIDIQLCHAELVSASS